MPPYLASDNETDQRFGNAISVGQRQEFFSVPMGLSDSQHIGACKFGHRMMLAFEDFFGMYSRSVLVPFGLAFGMNMIYISLFLVHIFDIVCVSAKKQVFGIYTGRIGSFPLASIYE
jgi:hypothetical protein